jgi:hypothetical protein
VRDQRHLQRGSCGVRAAIGSLQVIEVHLRNRDLRQDLARIQVTPACQ